MTRSIVGMGLGLGAVLLAACGGGGGTADDATDTPAIDAAAAVDAPSVADAPPAIPDAALLTCGDSGAATLTGTIGGETFDPTGALMVDGGSLLVVHSAGGTCAGPNGAAYLAARPCDGTAWAAGTYDVVPTTLETNCTTAASFGVIYSPLGDPGTYAYAESGTLTVASIDAGCIQGSLTATFAGGDVVTSAFASVTCPAFAAAIGASRWLRR